ncbi:MAG: site-2 protease family protein [Phycisphaerae bacterium]
MEPSLMVASLTERLTPLFGAALLAWILCVCVHEFSHALVAYWGGDTSVREKGYLSLDPTRFIDPMFSLLVPAIVLALGGLPLPGGSVQIDHARLRSAKWSRYVSAAGPASNLLLFLAFALPLHPRLGLVEPFAAPQPTWVYFFGAMAVLNFVGTLFNLIPIPPLDGYGMIEHRFSYEMQFKLRQNAMVAFGALFMLFWVFPPIWQPFWWMFDRVSESLGFPTRLMIDGFNYILFGVVPRAF